MKVLVLSDLHLELGEPFTVPAGLHFDFVVLAGDISSPGSKAVFWAQRESTFRGRPVLLVAGNHEFYRRNLDELEVMKAAAEGSNVHVLDRSCVVIDGVRFVGCTLWTDYQLPVLTDAGPDVDVARAMRAAGEHLNDHQLIDVSAQALNRTYTATRDRQLRRRFTPADAIALHWIDRDWLRRQLLDPFDGPTVVVTHHAPSAGSVAAKYAADWLTPAFASQLPDEFFVVPQLWVHGHTHTPADYMVASCRVVSNPRGYRLRDSSFENHLFDAGFIVEVAR